MKISEIIKLWENDKKLYVKKSTYSAYLLLIENHINPYFADKEQITEEDVQKFVLTELRKGLSQKSIKDIKYDKFVLLLETNKNAQLSFAQINNQPYSIDFQKYKNILILDLLTTGTNSKIDKIIKLEYVLLNSKLDIVLCGEFYVKHDKLQISEKFKTKYNVSLKGVECGQDENFIFDLIQQLMVSSPLLVSFNVNFIKKFLYKFLEYYGEEKIIESLDTLDLLTVYKENNKNKKIYNLKNAIKYYDIDYQFYKNKAMIHYLLLSEMIKNNDINLYIKSYKK